MRLNFSTNSGKQDKVELPSTDGNYNQTIFYPRAL